jgi:hypothetical protein
LAHFDLQQDAAQHPLVKPRRIREKWDVMNAENVRVNLRYERADLKALLRYAKVHDVERDGRYDLRKPPRLNIWTHTWCNPGCRAESSLMFSLDFDWNTSSLMLVMLQPGYDWQIFLDELAKLEKAALGGVVYGKHRAEPIA